MARTIVQPQCSVSPAGGGTIAYQATTSGSFSFHGASAYQNYQYTATPAAGYRFVRFEVTVKLNWAFHFPNDPGGDYSGEETLGPSWYDASNVYESNLSASGTINSTCGGAYWYAEDYGWEQYEYWLSSITVVAVFELIPQGPYLLYDDGPNATGRLIYDNGPNATGLLVYGGATPP